MAGRTAGGPRRFSLFVRLAFDRLHLRGADLCGRREHGRRHSEGSFLQYCRCYPYSPPRWFAHARDRQNRVRLAWTSIAGDYHADPPPIRYRGWTSLLCSLLGGRAEKMGKPDQQHRDSILRLQRFLRLGERKNLEPIWPSVDRSDSSLRRCSLCHRFNPDLSGSATGATQSRRRNCLLLLLREENARDGDSTGDSPLRLQARPEFDSPADHVLSSVPALH